jgi:hypothetical protein
MTAMIFFNSRSPPVIEMWAVNNAADAKVLEKGEFVCCLRAISAAI